MWQVCRLENAVSEKKQLHVKVREIWRSHGVDVFGEHRDD
jgi:hypothetical protein